MKLVEVVQCPETSRDTLATGFALARKLGKNPVLSGICDGFIGNRILSAYRRQADYLLMDGATPAEVDAERASASLADGVLRLELPKRGIAGGEIPITEAQ